MFVAILCLVSQAQPPDTQKKPADTKTIPSGLPVIKLPDGTLLLSTSPADGSSESVTLTLQDFQKIQEQLDQLKKQVALQKPAAPTGCAIRGRIEKRGEQIDKRGEQLVAILKITYSFRTTLPQTTIALGGRKGFLVPTSAGGKRLPILETTDDGFAALIESPGDHTITLDFEAPVTTRGAKTELGFEIGLPRAPITTLTLEPPRPDVKLVNLTTRTPDSSQPNRQAEPRRVAGFDIKQLASRPGQEEGHALGPIESLEVTWEPPAAATQPVDQVQSAELDIAVLFTEANVETTAKIKLHGPARHWEIIAPQSAELNADRANGTAEVGPSQSPNVIKPNSSNKPVWKIELPVGSSVNDWVITVTTRQRRGKSEDPKYGGPFPIGPFTVLNVLRQTGTVKVTGNPHTHFTFKHGLDLRREPVPGPAEEDVTVAFFRLTTGPTGSTLPTPMLPLFIVEASLQTGSVVVKPTYKLTLDKVPLADDVWRIRAEIRVSPIHTTLDSLAIEIPAEWPEGAEASLPSESIPGVALGTKPEGFWAVVAAKLTKGGRVPTILRLPSGQKQPFDLILTAIVRVPAGTNEATIPLLRFPGAVERDITVTATVPEGQEIRGDARGWDGDSPASWGIPLTQTQGQSGKPSRTITSVTGKSETSLSRVILAWNAALPDLVADIRAEVTISDRQMDITEQVKLKSADRLPPIVRFHPAQGITNIAGLKVYKMNLSSFEQLTIQQSHVPGEWMVSLPAETKEVTLKLSFAIPNDRRQSELPAWNLPVGLFWPAGATRTDSLVRIWSNTITGRTIANLSPNWRELPVEPMPERDALPSLTLSGSNGEMPLTLEAHEVSESSSITVWVDRSLIQAWAADDEATRFRARFLLRKWLGPAIEVRLPAAATGSTPEFLRDGQKILDVTPISDPGGTHRAFRIPLPDPSVTKSATFEIRYQLPTVHSEIGETAYPPPLLSNSVFVGPIRWQVTVPQGTIPFLVSGATPEFHWRWRIWGLAPVPARSSSELEKWFQAGDEIPTGEESVSAQGESITARQIVPASVSVYRFPRTGFAILCSVVLFFLTLTLSRLPISVVGPVIAVLCGIVGISAVLLPHIAAQVAGACQAGLVGATVVLMIQAGIRSYYHHRINHLPGFARIHPVSLGSVSPLPPSTRNRPANVGSVSAAPVAPAGG